jgi:uncharacterized protein involved in exopolysaccharide biosynthesis
MEEVKRNIDSTKKPIIQDDEIDLVEVAKTIWNGRNLILKVTGVFLLLGIFIAFGSKVEYEASCKLMPESQEGMKPNLGGLGSLVGMAGIDLGAGGAGALTPELYPEIAQSVPFLLKILNEPIHFEKQDTTATSYNYFKEVDKPSILSLFVKYTIMLPFQVKAWLTNDERVESVNSKSELIRLSKEDTELVEMFRERKSVSVDSKSGIISLTTEMPDALASAEMANLSVELLTEYITEYKISKAQKDLDFASARYEEAKTEFEKSQEKLAIFTDRNKNVVTAFAQTEHQRLQNEYNINYEIYKGLVTQLEQAKFKVK